MDKQSAQEIIKWLDENQAVFTGMSDQIWQTPEIAYQEFKSSRLQADYLEKEGFSITWEVGGLNTAFVAEWGQSKPILGHRGVRCAAGIKSEITAHQRSHRRRWPWARLRT